jgi:hypothetical protein
MKKRQHATLTLVDTEDGNGFTAQVTYQPSLKTRRENSPAVNAMVRLSIVIARARESLAAPIENVTPKPLTKWQKVQKLLKLK